MRRPILPSDTELLKLEAAGHSYEEIGRMFGVSRQAVNKRFNAMGEYQKVNWQDVTAVIPWDLSKHPAKRLIRGRAPYIGLRAFLRVRMGLEVSPRSAEALRALNNHVEAGEVLALDPVEGPVWVPRDPERDGSLIIRWPDDVPRDERAELLKRVD